jgi:acylphosphatase
MTSPGDETPSSALILVSGRVQGVGFRAFARRVALRCGLTGGARNLDDGRVEVEVEGPRGSIDDLVEAMKQGPPGSRVDRVDVRWRPWADRYTDFDIWF